MTDAYEPPLEANQEPIETEEKSPLIQAIMNFRDRLFSVKKEEEAPKTDGELIEKLKVRYGFEITPQELSEIRRSANGVGLVDNADVLKFVVTVPKILFDLNEIHRIEKKRAEKLKDPLKLRRWQAEVNSKIEWALATYAARYTAKQNPNYNPVIDERLDLRLSEDEMDGLSIKSATSEKAVLKKRLSNVFSLADHPHKPTQPVLSEKPKDNGPKPIQPDISVA